MMEEELTHEVSGCSHPQTTDSLNSLLDRLSSSPLLDIDLPVVCVFGDTSSGKSSVLSQLSGVELPSSSTLTTKCPIRLSLSPASTRRAVIEVAWHDETAAPVFERRAIDEDEWHSITNVILEAQEAILLHRQTTTAADVVMVSVQGPAFARDLTLIDLPGWVRSRSDDESPTMIQEVAQLIDSYLCNRRCIVLAVVPANVDFHNSELLEMARKVDPTTARTIAVLTKPDLIDSGAEESVMELLFGHRVNLSLGFHLCKGRGQAALNDGCSIEHGLEAERVFFDSTEPWKSLEDRTILGTDQLRAKLSSLQAAMIRATLPAVLEDLRTRQRKAQATLVAMGKPLLTDLDRRRYYQEVCGTLIQELQSSLSGKKHRAHSGPSAAARLHEAIAEFTHQITDQGSFSSIGSIVEGAQVLVSSPRGVVRGEVVHVDENFVCVDRVDPADAKSEVLFDSTGGVEPHELIEENDVWSDGSRVYVARSSNLFDTLKKIPKSHVRTDPTWLKEKIANNRTDDLACFLNIDIFKNIVGDFVEIEWKPHCLALLDKTRGILVETIDASIDLSQSSSSRFPDLHELMDKQCRSAVRDLMAFAVKQVVMHLDTEKHPYTSLSDDLFYSITAARNARLRRELEVSLRLDQEGVFDTQAIKALVDDVFERHRRRSVDDHMAEEMELVLDAYGTVATKRVLDRVPMVGWDVFRSFVPSIQNTLWSVTDEALQQSLVDSAEVASKYQDTARRLEEVNKAIAMIEEVLY